MAACTALAHTAGGGGFASEPGRTLPRPASAIVDLPGQLSGEIGFGSLPPVTTNLALSSVSQAGLVNRQWNHIGSRLNSGIVTSLGNPDALEAWGGVQIVPNGSGVTPMVSLSGHNYTLSPVPEPGRWALLLGGGLLVAWRRRAVAA